MSDEQKHEEARRLWAAQDEQRATLRRMKHPEVHRFGPPLRRTLTGWAVFSGTEGEDPQLVAIFADKEDAEAWSERPDPEDPECRLLCDPGIEPACVVAAFDNDFTADWFKAP